MAAKEKAPAGKPEGRREMSTISQAILERIHLAREATGMNQGELMHAAGLYDQWFSKRANGHGEVRCRDVFVIADALGVSVASLLGLDGAKVESEDRPLDSNEHMLIGACRWGSHPIGAQKACELIATFVLTRDLQAGRVPMSLQPQASIAEYQGSDVVSPPARRTGPGRPPLRRPKREQS